MLHPDSPRLAGAMVYMAASEDYDLVLGSRILAQNAVAGGMPRYKYVASRRRALDQNLMLGQKLSEYHTGYRAFTRAVLESIPWLENSDDFLFGNQILCQTIRARVRIGEISYPARLLPRSIIDRLSEKRGLRIRRPALLPALCAMDFASPRIAGTMLLSHPLSDTLFLVRHLLALVLLTGTALGCGDRVAARLRVMDGLERRLASLVVGLGLLATLFFALGAVRLLYPAIAWLVGSGRSALECARALCADELGPQCPSELAALLATHPDSNGATLASTEPECRIPFDK